VRESGSKNGGDVVGDLASVLGIGDRGNLQRKESGCDEEEKDCCLCVRFWIVEEMPPPIAIDAGLAVRIVGQREVMISLVGLSLVLLTLLLGRVNSAVILLTSSNETWSFPDAEANFGT
jgi:hypothetical protein